MRENQALENLFQIIERVFLLQPITFPNAPLANAFERFTIDELHHQ